MGCIDRVLIPAEENGVSESLSDALLFTTMCIIGLPVDVHVKDGSIYSGIFHTACVDENYAIVLKKARMIKKGNQKANIANGWFIETLIVLSEDLVQVVAKEVPFPAEGTCGSAGPNAALAMNGIAPQDLCQESGPSMGTASDSKAEQKEIKCRRLLRDGSDPKQTDFKEVFECQAERTTNHEVQASIASSNASESLPSSSENGKPENHNWEKLAEAVQHPPVLSSCASPAVTSVINTASELCLSSSSTSTKIVPPRNPYITHMSKESKLNPRAKVFSPSPMHHRSATPPSVLTLASTTYMPDPSPATPIATAEPQVDAISSAYHISAPAKFLPQNNIVYVNGRNDLHYSHPIAGNPGGRTQPVSYSGQYNHFQPGPAFVHPNSQNVMAGRLGPLIYMHPISNDVVAPSTAGFPPVPVRPPQPINFPKHQGTATMQSMQLYLAPPFIANTQQPLSMPSYIPISQPLFPIPVPGSESSFGAKFT